MFFKMPKTADRKTGLHLFQLVFHKPITYNAIIRGMLKAEKITASQKK